MSLSEQIELNALRALHRVATPAIRTGVGIHDLDNNGTYVSIASRLPKSAIVINRAFAHSEGEETLRQIANAYAENGVERFFIHLLPDAKIAGEAALSGLSLKEARAWQKFSLKADGVIDYESKLKVVKLAASENTEFAKIVCDAFDLGDMAIPWLARLPMADKWHSFAALIDNHIAGVGSLYIKDKQGWLDFGATAPDFRCRGCQSAVLNARIQFAFDQGCEELFTCTGVDVEGDPQHSFQNIVKFGFTPTYIRRNVTAAE